MGDAPVPEAGQVLHGLRHALVVGGPDDVDAVRRHRASHGDHRQLSGQGAQPGGRRVGTQQDQRLAPRVEEGLHRSPVVAGPGDRAQDQVVAVLLGSLVDVLDQLGVERAADVHHDADEPAAPAGQQAGGTVGPVTQAARRVEDPIARGSAGAGRPAQHE